MTLGQQLRGRFHSRVYAPPEVLPWGRNHVVTSGVVNACLASLLIDTGSAVSLIQGSVWRSTGTPLRATRVPIVSANGHPLGITRLADAQIEVGRLSLSTIHPLFSKRHHNELYSGC